jgi:hypothetical protein
VFPYLLLSLLLPLICLGGAWWRMVSRGGARRERVGCIGLQIPGSVRFCTKCWHYEKVFSQMYDNAASTRCQSTLALFSVYNSLLRPNTGLWATCVSVVPYKTPLVRLLEVFVV